MKYLLANEWLCKYILHFTVVIVSGGVKGIKYVYLPFWSQRI